MLDLKPLFQTIANNYLFSSTFTSYFELQNEVIGKIEWTINDYQSANKKIDTILLDPVAYSVLSIYLMNEYPLFYKNIIIDNYKFDGNTPGVYKILIDDTLPQLTVKVLIDIESYINQL